MRKIKGPGIFLAQFLRDEPPYNELGSICAWASGLGYRGVQIPSWDARTIDLAKAADSKAYCDDLKAKLSAAGVEPTEVAAHLQGQVLAIHPAYEIAFAAFYPKGLDDKGRAEWAPFIAKHIIEATEVAFDDFAGAATDEVRNRKILGLA